MKFPEMGSSGGSGGKAGLFIKLKDGEKVRGVFMGDPHPFRLHWISGRSQVCSGKECSYCKSGDESKFRFRVNFLTKEDGVWVAKILEQGYGLLKTMKALHEGDPEIPGSAKNLHQHLVWLKREGEGKDTEYKIYVQDTDKIQPKDLATLAKIPLNDLSLSGNKEAPKGEGSDANEDDLPF